MFPLNKLMLAFCIEKSFQHDFRYLRSKETLASYNGFHSFWEALCKIRFQNISIRSGVQCTTYQVI